MELKRRGQRSSLETHRTMERSPSRLLMDDAKYLARVSTNGFLSKTVISWAFIVQPQSA
jgi:hypothetical protein